jgi:hypothetical protein
MAGLDALPPDQRAALSLILRQGRSYDDLADMLGIGPDAVRTRAYEAVNALGPTAGRTPALAKRQEVADYLLGQQDEEAQSQTRTRLAEEPHLRAWARAVAGELKELAREPLPEIPSQANGAAPARGRRGKGGSRRGRRSQERAEQAAKAEAPAAAPAEAKTAEARAAAAKTASGSATGSAEPPKAPAAEDETGFGPPGPRSRLLGVALAGLVLVVAVVVAVLLLTGGDDSDTSAAGDEPATQQQPAGPAGIIAQVNLTAPGGDSKTAGVAQIVREQNGDLAMLMVGQGLKPTRGKQSYAVWLAGNGKAPSRLGFAPPVRRNGRLQAASVLPKDTPEYNEMIVSLETTPRPPRPTNVVMRGGYDIN